MGLLKKTALTLAGVLVWTGIAASSASAGVSRECETTTSGRNIQIAYEVEGSRKRFMAVLTLPKNSATPGKTVIFQIHRTPSARAVTVATRSLAKLSNGKLVAKVYFDSNDKPGGVVKPFPSNFPTLGLPAKGRFKLGSATLASCDF